MSNLPSRQDNLWSVIFEMRYWYLGSFIIIAIPSEMVVIMGEITVNQGIINTWRAIVGPSSDVMTMSAGGAFMITETGRAIMVLAHGIKKWFDRKEEERDNKFREEGMAKANEAWTAWNARREETQARGEPFSEPPPTAKP